MVLDIPAAQVRLIVLTVTGAEEIIQLFVFV